MPLTLEQVRQREQNAKEALEHAKEVVEQHRVLTQWYYVLGSALERSGGPEPDFSFVEFQDARWIVSTDEKFVRWVIGDQLMEYGLVLKTITVYAGSDDATRIYIGKPGQFDQYKQSKR